MQENQPMTEHNPAVLGEFIKQARIAKGLGSRELANRVGLAQSNIVRIEQGHIAEPKPSILGRLAEVLDLDMADVYNAAGYPQPEGLPSFTPYLRSKYKDLPPEARAELEQSFSHIAQKYGYDAAGPAPGQDEA
jgi:transcriptional regulator with XRE-family HTH domain